MKRFILILVTTVQLLSSLYYKNCLFYVLLSLFCWFVGLAAYVFCLHTETIKSLNGNRCQFIYYARLSLHTVM